MTEYISREEAIKELREVYENEYPTASGDFDEYASHDMPNVLRNIPAADVQPVDRWISVKDRLPDENQKCLVYRDINADLKITTGIWHSDWKEFCGLRHGTRLEDTIAWMPLPEPPKESDTECHDTK